MSEIDNVILCLKKIKKKSLGQNKEHLTNYLVKDYGFDKVNATELRMKPKKFFSLMLRTLIELLRKMTPQYLHQIHNLLN